MPETKNAPVRPNDAERRPRALTRRNFLTAALGLGAAALAPAVTPPLARRRSYRAAAPVTVTFVIGAGEVADEELNAFMDANPTIKVERIDSDSVKLDELLTSRNPPDVFRTTALALPNFVIGGLLMDLTERMKASPLIRLDDLASACEYYVVDGRYYGLPKDWSPDFSLFISNAAAADSNVALPSVTTPMSYAEVAALAAKLTRTAGAGGPRLGFDFEPDVIERILARAMAEDGGRLYSADYTTIQLKGNTRVTEVMKYFYDLSRQNITWNPLKPMDGSTNGNFAAGKSAIVQYGYWFSGYLSATQGAPAATMLPAASFGGSQQRVTPTQGPSGLAVGVTTKNPDAAFRLFEWYTAGDPARARAKSGWGVPALKSLNSLMPADTPFQKQVQAVLKLELETANQALEVNPYIDSGAIATLYVDGLEQALKGQITVDQWIEKLETDVNAAIQQRLVATGLATPPVK